MLFGGMESLIEYWCIIEGDVFGIFEIFLCLFIGIEYIDDLIVDFDCVLVVV